ncbi:MAG: bifunctional DNA primase/polymerase [Anaerolineae bacterium]|nr:bifunctional DNA primase/polymerase [Anaerolineae bacterium]
MQFFNDSQTLLTLAEAYSALGYSVIPLLGDRDLSRPKVPAIPWGGFQTYRASLNDYKQWFTESGFAGLGIVTGRISQLVVLDFDSESLYTDFKTQYPDLLETHTVRSATRQLPHLYFKLPPHLYLASQKGQGIDLLSDGHYVVAPPTFINDQPYQVTRGGMPKILTERDVRRLTAFVSGHKPHRPVIAAQSELPVIRDTVAPIPSPKPTSIDLENLYRYHCQKSGRNEALFKTSLYARDAGWNELETQQCLVNVHVEQSARTSQPAERPAQRQHEALKTIHSAFSRPARSAKPRMAPPNDQLSNSVREALIQQGMTGVVRTIEGLYQVGVRPGQMYAVKDAVQSLKGVVGRDSVLAALQTQHHGQRLFTPLNPRHYVATDHSLDVSKNAYLILSENQEKVGMGRPGHHFLMPSNSELCRLFGVKVTTSDPLSREDLVSARQTRMALHRELIKRRPGSYPQRWLAQRLGVSRRTIHAYNQLIPIHSRAMFLETFINWKTIERLPFDEALQGAFLQTGQGKKYPALRIIAAQLLANGHSLSLNERTVNFYWYGDVEPPMPQMIQIRHQQVQKQLAQTAFLAQIKPSTSSEAYLRPRHQPVNVAKTPKNIHRPLADTGQEALVQHIYNTLNTAVDKHLSLVNARRIVLMHSEDRVRAALKCLQQRKTVINPTGFLTTLLRSNHLK